MSLQPQVDNRVMGGQRVFPVKVQHTNSTSGGLVISEVSASIPSPPHPEPRTKCVCLSVGRVNGCSQEETEAKQSIVPVEMSSLQNVDSKIAPSAHHGKTNPVPVNDGPTFTNR